MRWPISRSSTIKAVKWIAVFGVLAALVTLYALVDPAEHAFFPRCPFRMLTGFDCPGCGSQRAVHDLLNLDIAGALRHNMMMVVAIPYLVVGFAFDMVREPSPRMLVWRRRLFGTGAIVVVLTLITLFWILRNIPFFSPWL